MNTNWLERMHAGLFSIPFGLFTLSGAWHRAVGFGWQVAADVSSALLYFATLVWVVLLVLYTAKCVRYHHSLLNEFMNPVQGALMALLPLSILMFVMIMGQPGADGYLRSPCSARPAVHHRARGVTAGPGQMPESPSPGAHPPPVTVDFWGPPYRSGSGWGRFCLAWAWPLGIAGSTRAQPPVSWPCRRHCAPLGIEWPRLPSPRWPLAPSAGIPGEVLIVGPGIAAGPILRYSCATAGGTGAVCRRLLVFLLLLAALRAVIEVARRGHWPALVGGIALLIASSVIAVLLVRTIILLWQGQLLPAGHTTPLAGKKSAGN
jgi:tellurite resistance protein